GGPRRPEPQRGGGAGRLVLPGPGGEEGAGGLHAGEVREKARRSPAGYGDLHHLPDRLCGPRRGSGPPPAGKIRRTPWRPVTFWWWRMTRTSTVCSARCWGTPAMTAARPTRG